LKDYWKIDFVKSSTEEPPFFAVGNHREGWLVDTERFRFWWNNFLVAR
jgi:hypothetical protein